jgi:putative spermidine/putrescine transport system substrate-binding protein
VISEISELVKLAQAEAELSAIGLSREWLNYGEIIESYKNTYGIRVIEQAPDASSSEQLATIRQTAGPDRVFKCPM